MLKRIVSGIMLTLLLATILTVTLKIQPVKADSTASVYVDPASQSVALGDSFNVQVLANFSSLSGFELKLLYDSTVMNGTSVTDYVFLGWLSPYVSSYTVEKFTDDYNSTFGFVYVVCTLSAPVYGYAYAPLVSIWFKSVALGDSAPLHLADVVLYENDSNPISPEDIDGTVTIAPNQSIYIHSDGSIDPASSPINQEGNTYTLTNNISSDADGIVIERDNVTLDGAGYTLSGSGVDVGIDLTGRINVTVKDMSIENFSTNVNLDDCWYDELIGDSIGGPHYIINSYGIYLQNSDNNTIFRNAILSQWEGIQLQSSDYNTFVENNITCLQAIAIMGQLNPSMAPSNYNVFYHNDFIGGWYYHDFPFAFGGSGEVNYWDDGYPSGGNYYYSPYTMGTNSFLAAYNGTDFFSGPYQNITGSDGIGDTPYVIGPGDIDHYPLMNPYAPPPSPSPPVANFSWSPTLPITGQDITFDASLSTLGWNGTQTMPIVSYMWDFGDNYTATGETVTHAYSISGNYTVTLNVTDSEGSWNTIQMQIQVGQPHGPVAAFTANPESGPVGELIVFNASTSIEGWNGSSVPITEYLWDFGDGNITSTNDSIIAHAYTGTGVFNATLTILDANSMYSSYSANVSVYMPTFVSVSTSSTSVLGSVVGINGTLQDAYGNGLQNETIVLYYTFPGVSSLYPISSSITDNLGNYYVQWFPPATGYFTVEAEWVGNATFNGASNTTTLSTLAYNDQYVFSVESNSTISALAFNSTDSSLSFTASGPSGTTGYTEVTLAKSLATNPANIAVYLDGNPIEYSITSTDDSWLLTFNYTHSTHEVVVGLNTSLIPEFPSITVLPLFMLFTMIGVVCLRRRKYLQRT